MIFEVLDYHVQGIDLTQKYFYIMIKSYDMSYFSTRHQDFGCLRIL